MTRTRRVLAAIAGSFLLIVGSWILTFVVLLAWSGVSTVSVKPVDGPDILVPLPMAAVEVAAWSAPRFVESGFEEITVEAELGEYAPMVLAIAEIIDDLPNGTLLEVQDGSDHIVVRQRRGRFLVEVDTDDVQIRIGVPRRSVARTLRFLGKGIEREAPEPPVFASPRLL